MKRREGSWKRGREEGRREEKKGGREGNEEVCIADKLELKTLSHR
jgi:hypothetical protein